MPKCLRKVPVLYGRNTVFYKGFPSFTVPPVGNHNNIIALYGFNRFNRVHIVIR